MRRVATMTTVAGMLLGAANAGAQTAERRPADQRFQIRQMERVLEGAVEHGASVTRDRLQAVMPPAEMLWNAGARARGYRLDGYGVFFHVEVPALEGTLPWSFAFLDRNNLGIESALRDLRSAVAKIGDVNLEQALKRIELQVTPFSVKGTLSNPTQVPAGAGGSPLAAAGLSTPAATAPPAEPTRDSIMNNPVEAYRSEIRRALMLAMLEHSHGLELGANEVLTVAARGSEDGPRLGLTDSSLRVTQITVRGSDLMAYFAGRISSEEAQRRMEVRVF